jgi:FixJ family two-component response regulator
MQMTSNNRRVVALIDGDAAVCDSMRCLLEAYGLDVQTYQGGPDFLNEEEPGIDCLIVDCYMLGLDGLELSSELRKRGSQVPIVMITATTNSAVQRRAAELGITRFLRSPSPLQPCSAQSGKKHPRLFIQASVIYAAGEPRR